MQIAAGFDDVDSAITQLFEGKEDPAPPRTRRKLGRR
jgi:hypothetical protein